MLRLETLLIFIASFAVLWSAPALAYIGPGAGVTVLGALWGVIVAIALTIGAVVLWPFRVLLRRRRKNSAKSPNAKVSDTGEAQENKTQKNDTSPPGNSG